MALVVGSKDASHARLWGSPTRALVVGAGRLLLVGLALQDRLLVVRVRQGELGRGLQGQMKKQGHMKSVTSAQR